MANVSVPEAIKPKQLWPNLAAVALANKAARRLWAAEHHRRSFDPNHLSTYPAHAATH